MDQLTEVDDLAAVAAAADRAVVRLVARLIERSASIAAGSGVTVDVWLGARSRLPAWERRDLLIAADMLPRMPALWAAWQDGLVCWVVVASVVRTVAREARSLHAAADELLGRAAVELADADPEMLLSVLSDWVAQVRHDREARREARRIEDDVLRFQPRLDGTGGTLWGDLAATTFAAVTDAIIDARPDPDLAANPDGDVAVAAANRGSVGHANALGLLKLCATDPDGTARRPLLIATVGLDTLLGLSDRPGRLVTQLFGGDLRISADGARRLAEGRIDLRPVILDGQGGLIGVGRIRRFTPGWLRQAQLALHTTCSFPGCRRPARQVVSDHAREFEDGGPTDAANTHPACHVHHAWKTPAYDPAGRRTRNPDWTVTVAHDATVTWTNRRAGLTMIQPSLPRLLDLSQPSPRPVATLAATRPPATPRVDRDPEISEPRQRRRAS